METEKPSKTLETWLGIIASAIGIAMALQTWLRGPTWLRMILVGENGVRWWLFWVFGVALAIGVARVWGLRVRLGPRNSRRALAVTGASVIAVVSLGVVTASMTVSSDDLAEAIFPESKELGGAMLRSWGSNGHAEFAIDDQGSSGGPDNSLRITFRNFGNTVDHSCGWALFLLRGIDLSDRKKLRFWMRGEHGDERIGIKAKDVHGTEIAPRVEHLPKILKEWRLVEIPLAYFGNVDFGAFDNFSLYSSGELSGTRPQTIFVGGFVLE